jgi:hypothetical protein
VRFKRIVLGLGTAASEPVIVTAAALARATELELLGLFVEDPDLLQLAALPFASEVAFPSAVTRPLNPESMARSLRARSQHARAALGRQLEGLSIRWNFAVVRGTVLAAMLEATDEEDLVVAPLAAGKTTPSVTRQHDLLRAMRNARRPLLLVGAVAAPHAPVTAVIAPDASLADLAGGLGALAIPCGGLLSVFTFGPVPSEGDEQAPGMAPLGGARPPRMRALDASDWTPLRRSIATERPGLVVLCGSGLPPDELLGLAELGCSLLLLPGGIKRSGTGSEAAGSER